VVGGAVVVGGTASVAGTAVVWGATGTAGAAASAAVAGTARAAHADGGCATVLGLDGADGVALVGGEGEGGEDVGVVEGGGAADLAGDLAEALGLGAGEDVIELGQDGLGEGFKLGLAFLGGGGAEVAGGGGIEGAE